jgi:hypothetical protein
LLQVVYFGIARIAGEFHIVVGDVFVTYVSVIILVLVFVIFITVTAVLVNIRALLLVKSMLGRVSDLDLFSITLPLLDQDLGRREHIVAFRPILVFSAQLFFNNLAAAAIEHLAQICRTEFA